MMKTLYLTEIALIMNDNFNVKGCSDPRLLLPVEYDRTKKQDVWHKKQIYHNNNRWKHTFIGLSK